jgi:uncharacterized protein (DUF1697 family)
MPVIISLLRAVNVGGNSIIKMEELRALYASLKLKDAQSYVQSGNVVFRTDETDLARLAKRIQAGIEKRFGARPEVILRTVSEMRDVVARNPFAKRRGIEPNKLQVSFLGARLEKVMCEQLKALPLVSEEIVPSGSELFIYFSNGIGKSKLPWAKVEKICAVPGTGRNWNSVMKLLAMAEALESAK